MYRHGDIMLVKAETLPKNSVIQTNSNKIRVAEGEATGHAHTVITKERPAVTFLAPDGSVYLQLDESASLIHQEHDTIELPVGLWWIVRQREYTPSQIVRVMD